MDYLARMAVFLNDLIKNLRDYSLVAIRVGKQGVRGLCIRENRRERLTQLVRNSAGQLADGGDAHQVGEFLALKFSLLLGVLPRRYIDIGADGTNRLTAGFVINDPPDSDDPAHFAVRAD